MSKKLSSKDYNLLTQIMRTSEKNLIPSLSPIIKKRYNDVKVTDSYLYAIGKDPVCIVSHVDTVFNVEPEDIFYDTSKNIMWSPQGLGADDRVGVFLILKILEAGYNPTIIFTTGEESGGIGASKFVSDFPIAPPQVKFLVELDRHGDKDCVFYSCGNQDFQKHIESYDFETNWGTFTDISIICPKWDLAGVNLSVGYIDEHSYTEHLKVGIMMNTLEKVKKIIKDAATVRKFDFQENKYLYSWKYSSTEDKNNICYACMKPYSDYMGMDFVTKDGKIRHLCDDCFSLICDEVGWCSFCYQPFELVENGNKYCCPNCAKESKEEDNKYVL